MIINFGAFVGEANCPNPTVYPATKTFCHKLTRDLQVQSGNRKNLMELQLWLAKLEMNISCVSRFGTRTLESSSRP